MCDVRPFRRLKPPLRLYMRKSVEILQKFPLITGVRKIPYAIPGGGGESRSSFVHWTPACTVAFGESTYATNPPFLSMCGGVSRHEYACARPVWTGQRSLSAVGGGPPGGPGPYRP